MEGEQEKDDRPAGITALLGKMKTCGIMNPSQVGSIMIVPDAELEELCKGAEPVKIVLQESGTHYYALFDGRTVNEYPASDIDQFKKAACGWFGKKTNFKYYWWKDCPLVIKADEGTNNVMLGMVAPRIRAD